MSSRDGAPVKGVLAHHAHLLGRTDEAPPAPPVKDQEREDYLMWLVEEYGPEVVRTWQDAPVTIEEWRQRVHRH
jgi:hypothetical protein